MGGRGNIRRQRGALLCLAESMILLGSIERTQVGALLSNQLSPHRRLLTLRQKALSEDGHRLSDPSIRFQVRAATVLGDAWSGCPPPPSPHHPIPPQISTETSSGTPARPALRKPLKPALKRVSSSPADSPPGESACGLLPARVPATDTPLLPQLAAPITLASPSRASSVPTPPQSPPR